MQVIIQRPETAFPKPDDPVCHVLSGNGKAIPFEFFFQPVQWNRIDILAVQDCSCQGGGNKASRKQFFRMWRFYHAVVCFTGINPDMVFLHLHFCRDKTVTP